MGRVVSMDHKRFDQLTRSFGPANGGVPAASPRRRGDMPRSLKFSARQSPRPWRLHGPRLRPRYPDRTPLWAGLTGALSFNRSRCPTQIRRTPAGSLPARLTARPDDFWHILLRLRLGRSTPRPVVNRAINRFPDGGVAAVSASVRLSRSGPIPLLYWPVRREAVDVREGRGVGHGACNSAPRFGRVRSDSYRNAG